jgi:hypothetical protein
VQLFNHLNIADFFIYHRSAESAELAILKELTVPYATLGYRKEQTIRISEETAQTRNVNGESVKQIFVW